MAARREAPMTDIAEAAGVSRSTLHRYFPDRTALRDAMDELAQSAWIDAVRSARLEEGSGLEAFRRLCAELLGRLDVLAWWMVRPDSWEDDEDTSVEGEQLITGHARGRAGCNSYP